MIGLGALETKMPEESCGLEALGDGSPSSRLSLSARLRNHHCSTQLAERQKSQSAYGVSQRPGCWFRMRKKRTPRVCHARRSRFLSSLENY